MNFDEQAYLAANPDVAAAVKAGAFSAAEHYQQYGQAEGRSPYGNAEVYQQKPMEVYQQKSGGAPSTSAQPNWASGAGYAANITAPAGTGAYYQQLNDAMAAYRAGTGVNPATGKLAKDEAGTFWNPGNAGMKNYFEANPDVMMNYLVNAGASGVDPRQYAIAHSDMGQTGYDMGRGGVLPTGQTTFERMLGREGGSLYNTFGQGSAALLDPRQGIVTPDSDKARYQQVYGTLRSNVGPFAGLEYQEDRNRLLPGLLSQFNSLGKSGTGAGAGGSTPSGGTGGASGAGAGTGVGSGAGTGTGAGTGSGSSSGSSTTISSGSPTLGKVTPDQTVEGRISNLLATDANGNYTNSLVRQASERATQAFAGRGLLNSSMAVQAAQEAAIAKAIEIAGPDAKTMFDQSRANQDAQNQFALNATQFQQDLAKIRAEADNVIARITQEAGIRGTETDKANAQALRQNYTTSVQQATVNYTNRVNQINASGMSPADKDAAARAAAEDRDSELAFINRMYSSMPNWSSQWGAVAVPTQGIDLNTVNSIATLSNIAEDPAQSQATRDAARARIAALRAATPAAPAPAAPTPTGSNV